MDKNEKMFNEINQELQKEDYELFKDKLKDIKGYEQIFKDAAQSVLDDVVTAYKTMVEETLWKLGYDKSNIHNVYRRSFASASRNMFTEIYHTLDDKVLLVGYIQVTAQGIMASVSSDIYPEPKQYVIRYE